MNCLGNLFLEALHHLESQVRRCSLFLLWWPRLVDVGRDTSVQLLAVLRSRIVLVGCEGTVLDKGGVIDQLEARWKVDSKKAVLVPDQAQCRPSIQGSR